MLKVRGYASVFGNIDSYGEVVDRGAFSDWIVENPDVSLGLYWEHGGAFKGDPPIGHTTKIKQDRKGLYFEGLLVDTPRAAEIQEVLAKRGKMPASFHFRVIDKYQKGEVWHLAKLELREISPVNWGANTMAYIEAAHDASEGESDDQG